MMAEAVQSHQNTNTQLLQASPANSVKSLKAKIYIVV